MKSITLNYCIAKAHLDNSPNFVCMPLHDRTVMQVNEPVYMLSGKFANKFQEKVLNKGTYDTLLNYQLPGDFEIRKATIVFKGSKKNLAFQELRVEFDYGAQATELGWWGVIPVLGIEAFSEKEEGLEAAVEETIRLEFVRSRRLEMLQSVISTQWFAAPVWENQEVGLNTYTPSELENLEQDKKRQLLPKVAERLDIKKRILYGYEPELKQLAEALKSKYNRSTLLVGKSGVGKTTLVWELAHQHHKLGVTAAIWETTAATLIKELTGRTGWQDQLSMLCREIAQTGAILFVRNMTELFEVGQYEGNSVSMGDYLREYIVTGELTLVSECTDEELARIDLYNPNYTALFQIIRIEEPKEGLEDIIRQKVEDIAKSQKINIEQEAILEAIRLHRRYTPYSGFPGKPIRFLESILLNLKKLGKQWDIQGKSVYWTLDRSSIISAFCEETGMPPFMVDPAIPMDMTQVEQFFAGQLFGQQHAVRTVVDMLASVKTALNRQGKPIVSMLFVGPTGVGKTELAKVLAQFMFGSRDKMLRFDMSEYSSPYQVARLTGESYFSDGTLTAAVRREPFCVLLFDEIEKADSSFNDLLLQLLGEGRLTDSQGQLVNFCSTIVIMTSNIGAQKLQTGAISFNTEINPMDVVNHFQNEVRQYFRPEIFNRIDQIVPFYPLLRDTIRSVVDRELDLLRNREGISHRNIDLTLTNEIYDWLCIKGYHPRYGARALQRALQEELIIPLAEKLNEYSYEDKLVIVVKLVDDKPLMDIETDPLKMELILEELTHNEYMDFASELRSKAYRLKEGRAFVEMSSNLTIMQNQKKHGEKQFWKKQENAENYAHFLDLQERYIVLRKEIDILEVDMALMGMGLLSLNVHLYEKLKGWEKSYNAYKLLLMDKIYKEYNTCSLGVFGEDYAPFLDIYRSLLDEKGYNYSMRSVWYREAYYNETVTVKILDLQNQDQAISELEESAVEKDENATTTRFRREYIYRHYDPSDKKALRIEQKNDQLLGVELEIKGTACNLFFNEEAGNHLIIKEDGKTKMRAHVIFSTEENTATEDLHRMSLSHKSVRFRRTYSASHIEDNSLSFPKREVAPNQQTKLLFDVLENRFNLKIDSILL